MLQERMRILDQVLGHENIIHRLLNAYQKQKLGAVYLFTGPSGVGKKKVALGLAQALVCEKSDQACGQCPSCLRVEHHQSESVLLIEPLGPQLKVEQAHQILKFLSLKHMGKSAVVVIDQAHLMNQQTANTLLKSLEEPAEDVFFILLTGSYSALLPTIRSRGQVVRFGPLSEDQIRHKSPESPLWAIKASRGSFERLIEFSHMEEQALRKKSAEVFKDLIEDEDFLVNEKWRDFIKDRATAKVSFFYWQTFLRDALVLKWGDEDQLINVDQRAFVESLSQIPVSRLTKMLQEILRMEQSLVVNADTQMLTEKFWVQNHSLLESDHA